MLTQACRCAEGFDLITKKAHTLDVFAAAQMLTCSHALGVTNSSTAASIECVKGLFIAV